VMHPLLPDEQLNLARHELAHAFLAHACGFYVEGIQLDPDEGRTLVMYPLAPGEFPARFAQSPLQAALAAARVLACIRAGSYCEIWAGQIGGEPHARDLARIESFREAMLPVYGHDGWTRIYAEAFRGLQQWYRHGSVQAVFREISPAIAQQRTITRWQLLSLFELAGASLTPEPRFATVLPPARRSTKPAPAQASSRPTQHRVEAQAVSSSSQGEESLLREDARYRYYGLDGMGNSNIFRRENKATGESRYMVSEVLGNDRTGKQRIKWHAFVSVSAARGELARLARG
jgi:hypothetical protein